MNKTTTLISVAAVALPAAASAEVNFGGWFGVEYDNFDPNG